MKNCRFVTAAVTEAEGDNFGANSIRNVADSRQQPSTTRVENSLPRRRLLESHQDPVISGAKIFDLPVLSISTISSTSSLGKYLLNATTSHRAGAKERRFEPLRQSQVSSADGVVDLMRKSDDDAHGDVGVMFRPGRKEKLQAEHFGSLRSCPQSSSDAEIHHSIKSEIGTTATTATLEPLKSDRNGLMKPPNGYIPVPVKADGPLLQDLFFPPMRQTGAKMIRDSSEPHQDEELQPLFSSNKSASDTEKGSSDETAKVASDVGQKRPPPYNGSKSASKRTSPGGSVRVSVGGRRMLEDRSDMILSPSFYHRNRLATRRVLRRLVHKGGDCNVSHINVPKQKRKYIRDIFTTLIDVKWRWSFLIFCTAFLLSWTAFAVIYYLICYSHGDFERFGERNFEPCVAQVKSFVAVFLFSVETQHTIGYGHRYVTDECPEAMVTICLQSILGMMIQAFMTGFVFAKLARPKKRAETLLFSKSGVICMRDGRLCFLFRVGDMRKSHIVEAHVRLQMIKKRMTKEGELLPFHQFDMNVGYDQGLDRIFLVWPITICHVIDESSPLYEYSAEDLLSARFEIVAILEGIVESTGMTTQARTSYLPAEIMWGHRFEKLVTYQRDNGEYRIDFARFHNTFTVETPCCSAKELDEMIAAGIFPDGYDDNNDENEDEDINYNDDADLNSQRIEIRVEPSGFNDVIPNAKAFDPEDFCFADATVSGPDVGDDTKMCRSRKVSSISRSGVALPPTIVVRSVSTCTNVSGHSCAAASTCCQHSHCAGGQQHPPMGRTKSILRHADIM